MKNAIKTPMIPEPWTHTRISVKKEVILNTSDRGLQMSQEDADNILKWRKTHRIFYPEVSPNLLSVVFATIQFLKATDSLKAQKLGYLLEQSYGATVDKMKENQS